MDLRKLKKLIELVEESDIDELEIAEKDSSVRIRRRVAVQPAAVGIPGFAGLVGATGSTSGAPGVEVGANAMAEAARSAQLETGHVVTSPMVGTFFRAPSPTSPPFVDIGQRVAVGDTLGIIEAMKILNPIETEVSGTVSSVLVENGRAIEYGEPLFIIEPD